MPAWVMYGAIYVAAAVVLVAWDVVCVRIGGAGYRRGGGWPATFVLSVCWPVWFTLLLAGLAVIALKAFAEEASEWWEVPR